jgi:hypothetical protein
MGDLLKKRFSLPNQERPISLHNAVDAEEFDKKIYLNILHASQQFRDEIADIYFGHSFKYHYNGRAVRYGEVMGVEPSERGLDWLFKMQDEFNVPISLTLNTLESHPEIVLDSEIRNQFVEYIRSFYERGLRICTVSNVHLMASGILQEKFPEMHWKNTVNHLVRSAQEVADYAALGYNTILLDRSLNRNFDELIQVKKVADLKGVKTSLLMSEGCLPSCPFKSEHDLTQADLQTNPQFNYWSVLGDLSCNRWRFKGLPMPRSGTDIVAPTKEILDILLNNVDVFKYSSRIAPGMPGRTPPVRNGYVWELHSGFEDQVLQCHSFKEVYENDLIPFNAWKPAHHPFAYGLLGAEKFTKENEQVYRTICERNELVKLWLSKKGNSLAVVLKTCKNQCWDCHACERVFGHDDVDSLVEVRKPTSSYLRKVDSFPIKVTRK